MTEHTKAGGLRKVFLLFAEALIVFYLALDAVVAPLFAPLLRWLAGLRVVIRLQERIAELPPYAILALLAIPFAIAEPAKLYALVLLATGHTIAGLALFVLAYVITLVVCERIYVAGRDKLRTIGWFARLIDWVFAFRDQALAWARSTDAWAFLVRTRQRTAALIARLRLRLGSG